MLNWLKNLFRQPQPIGQPQTIKRFDNSNPTITKEGIVSSDDGWLIEVVDSQTVRLFDVSDFKVDNCLLSYSASLKSAKVAERAYLEMWCRIPGRGEFFSKGFHNALRGTTDWASYEIPFYLKHGQRPDLVKLNLTIEGGGSVWIKDIELSYTPLE
jgi:hypothetical protein